MYMYESSATPQLLSTGQSSNLQLRELLADQRLKPQHLGVEGWEQHGRRFDW